MHSRFSTVSLILILLCFWAPSSVNAASLVSTVDRNRISINDTLTLTISLDQQADSSELNLKSLETNFDVLSVNPLNSSSVTVSNGKTEQAVTTQWSIRLVPKREGTLTIPAFNVKGTSSQAISIRVESSPANSLNDAPLSVVVRASETEVFPNQQIILTVELAAQADVSNLDGSPLTLANAEVTQLGQNASKRVDNGVARQIIQLKYAIFAKQAGTFEIPSLIFSGIQGAQRSFLGTRGKRVNARSKALSLTVKEPPSSVHTWLPLQNLKLSSELSEDPSQYQVGTPITRKVIIKAEGQSAEAIPPNTEESTSDENTLRGYKSYQDKPQLHTETTDQGLVGTRIESTAIVPSVAGEITLPEIRFNWWNVAKREWQETILPAETLLISESTALTNEPSLNDIEANIVEPSSATTIDNAKTSRLWPMISAALLLVCVLQFVLLMRKAKRSPEQASLDHTERQKSEGKAWQQLQSALQSGEASTIRQCILHWARASAPSENDTVSLMSLTQEFESEPVTNTLAKFEAHLYSSKESEITKGDLNALRESLKSMRQKRKQNLSFTVRTKFKGAALKPLYPE